jgi:putative hemolysin
MIPLLIASIVASSLLSLLFSTLTFSLRDHSRARLEDCLRSRGRGHWLAVITEFRDDFIFVTATWRLLANMLILTGCLRLFEEAGLSPAARYAMAVAVAAVLCTAFSVALPTALAAYFGESLLTYTVRLMNGLRIAMKPLTAAMRCTDRFVKRLAGPRSEPEPEEIEKDILSVVEEGQKEGVVDIQERRMIESVIEFRDAEARQTMTARPEIVALEVGATLEEVKRTIEASGHSRLPVYDGTLDHVVGILYARDLLKYIGRPPDDFDIRALMRPAIFVPETKPLRSLLLEFREQKVHIAIVLDEYGGTAGLVTIEDILEELVGEISDEHEPQEPPMIRRLSDGAVEVDARLSVDDLNHLLKLSLPEDAGYETVGGFLTTVLGRIPQKGTVLEQHGARFTVLDAEPQRVRRIRIELLPQTAPAR